MIESCIILREVTMYPLKLNNHHHKHLSDIFRHAMIFKKLIYIFFGNDIIWFINSQYFWNMWVTVHIFLLFGVQVY